jgi:hypothetical protein
VKLLIYRGDTLERTVELTDRDLRIGRGVENDIVLEDPEKTVSRFHAELRQEQGSYVLFDLNSQNGTWIDGQRIQRQPLNAGQTALLGNFRIVLDSSAGVPAAAAPATDTLAPTMMLNRDAVGAPPAAAGAVGAAGQPGASAAAAPGGPAASAPAQGGLAPRRPNLAPRGAAEKKGITSIPRPMFYGGALVFMVLIIGVMYVMRPRPPQSEQEPQPPPLSSQQAAASTQQPPPAGSTQPNTGGAATTEQPAPSGPETNEQIVARYVKDGRAKLDAGDAVGAIESFNRALMIDPSHADALDLKMKAEERRHQQQQQAQQTQAGASSTPSGTSASSATTQPGTAPGGVTHSAGAAAGGGTASGAATQPGTAPGGATRSAGTASAAGGGGTGAGSATQPGTTPGGAARSAGTTPAAAAGTTGAVSSATGAASAAAARKERAARDAASALQRRYAQAKTELNRGDYEHAITDFEAVLRDKPGYQDAASLLDQAKGLRHTEAQRAMSQATTLAAKGEFASAIREYERAGKVDPSLPGVQDGIAGVRKQMRDAGEQAYRRARQLDAVGRTQDALPLYQRAVDLLPADDPSGKAARDRLEALKGQGQNP